jgi:hypothetical protein
VTTSLRGAHGPCEGRPTAGPVLAALAAILAVVVIGIIGLLASPASAASLPTARNAVAPIHTAISQRVGPHEPVLAGQRRARAPNYDQTVVGHCVGAESEGVSVASGEGAASAPASVVRMVSGDESQADLFNELKARTFETGNEHALVTLSSGDQAIVSGGAEGITNMDIENLIAHTHPYQLPATGVSDADYAALNQLGQENSILLEQGQEIPFGVDDPQYLKLFGDG